MSTRNLLVGPEDGLCESCETLELEISALVDGELDNDAVLEVVDHLTRCESCRDFYRQARRLAQEVALADGRRLEPAAELWTAIAAAAAENTRPPEQIRRGRRAGLALAAIFVLAFGAWRLLRPTFAPAPAAPVQVAQLPSEIVLGGATTKMTDQRFVELTTELLEADPRYRHELGSILQQVATALPTAEDGSVDSSWPDESTVLSEVFRSGSSSGEWRSATF